MAEKENSNSVVWFLAGIGVGALLGVLYAPRSGRETRQALREKAEEGRDYVITRGRQAKEQAQQWAEKGRESLGKHKESLSAALDAGVQAYREATGEGSKSKV
ncbi:MAG: YtxH domain-containing protein [Terriglobales bacterium]